MSNESQNTSAKTDETDHIDQEPLASSDIVLVANSQTSDTTASSTRTRTSDEHSTATDISLANVNPSIKDTQLLDPEPKLNIPNTDASYRVPGEDGSSSPSSHGSRSPSQRSKRMASGIAKPADSSTAERALGAGAAVMNAAGTGMYRRKSNMDATGRKISELSLQLKTRLTYAMIKVQNGWENRSIDEVESLAASAFSSPMSTTSTTMARGAIHSPRTTMAAVSGSRLRGGDTSRSGLPTPQLSVASRSGLVSSAWPRTSPNLQGQAGQQPRTLAPAPDLRPRSRHQPQNSNAESLRSTTPTPQEKDAVDTLLFMSSPANSQRFTRKPENSSIQNSPSRGQFNVPQPRRALGPEFGPPTLYDRASASSEEEVLLSTSSKRGVSSTMADAERRAKRRSYGRLENEMDVDRLLDQMRDVASSEEETDITMPVPSTKPVAVRT